MLQFFFLAGRRIYTKQKYKNNQISSTCHIAIALVKCKMSADYYQHLLMILSSLLFFPADCVAV